jgi:tetratricopeptide (TPR) repeat protein
MTNVEGRTRRRWVNDLWNGLMWTAWDSLFQRMPDQPTYLLQASKLCTTLGHPRRAYQALDRLLNMAPQHEKAWRQLGVVLAKADPQLAFWIGLRAGDAKRIELMVSALKALLAANADSSQIARLLPDSKWPSETSDLYWTAVVSQLDPAQLQTLARDADLLGRAIEAETLLRKAVAAFPATVELRLALVASLEARSRYPEAEIIARQAITLAPELAEPLRTLARVQTQLARPADAANTLASLLALAPDDPLAWFEYGQFARYTYDLPAEAADQAFSRAADLAVGDPHLLEMVAQYFLEQHKFSKAAESYERLLNCNPRALDNTVTCRDYARCLLECNRANDAADVINAGLECALSRTTAAVGEDLDITRREQALLLLQAGRSGGATAVLNAIRDSAVAPGFNFERPEYLPSTPKRLQRLRDIVAGRDLVAFLPGPSLTDFAARLDELVSADFAAAALGSFPPIERELKGRLGRGADFLAATHPSLVGAWYPELQEFLVRPSPNLLLTSHYALSNLQAHGTDFGEFAARHDDRLLLAYPAGGPPLPSRPLHLEGGNSLSFLLPLMVIGRPRRIFIVGADGGGHPNFKRPYFYYNDIDADGPEQGFTPRPQLISYKNRPERLEEANRRLRIAAIECDRIVLSAFRFLESIFDFPIPPVFNICPHSAHRAFPRIDTATAIAMLRDQPR